MTITFHVWMLVPAALVLGALVMFWLGERETGGYGGLGGIFQGLAGIALLIVAGAFMLGRWLA